MSVDGGNRLHQLAFQAGHALSYKALLAMVVTSCIPLQALMRSFVLLWTI